MVHFCLFEAKKWHKTHQFFHSDNHSNKTIHYSLHEANDVHISLWLEHLRDIRNLFKVDTLSSNSHFMLIESFINMGRENGWRSEKFVIDSTLHALLAFETETSKYLLRNHCRLAFTDLPHVNDTVEKNLNLWLGGFQFWFTTYTGIHSLQLRMQTSSGLNDFQRQPTIKYSILGIRVKQPGRTTFYMNCSQNNTAYGPGRQDSN